VAGGLHGRVVDVDVEGLKRFESLGLETMNAILLGSGWVRVKSPNILRENFGSSGR